MKSMFRNALAAGALIAGMAASSNAGAVNLIVDGGFEIPLINTFYQNYGAFSNNPYSGATFSPAWSIPVNNVDIVSDCCTGYAAYQGRQLLDLVGYGSTGAVSQSFATVAGRRYSLSFAYADNPGSGFSLSNPARASLLVSGSGTLLSGSISHGTATGGNLNWNLYSNSFVANSVLTTLAFNTTNGQSNGGIFLDAVAVSAVPETSTWIMMLLGFAGLGFAGYRRNKAVAA